MSIFLTHANESLVTKATNRRSDGRGGYKSSPGDYSHIDTYWLRAIILLAPVNSEGASLKGSLGSLLFGIRPRIQVLEAPR
jgi:hypothetical protein